MTMPQLANFQRPRSITNCRLSSAGVRSSRFVETCTYLVSHSLGAMPRKTAVYLQEFADMWSTRGVRAWHEGWWEVGRETGNLLAPILGVADQHDLDAPERDRRTGHHRVVLHLPGAAAEDRDERAGVPLEPLPVRGVPPLWRGDRLRAVRGPDSPRPAAVPRRDRRAHRARPAVAGPVQERVHHRRPRRRSRRRTASARTSSSTPTRAPAPCRWISSPGRPTSPSGVR